MTYADNSQTSRDRILEAATAMVADDPRAPFSVRQVAARAGVSVGSLRHHFPSQAVLRDAVLTAIYDAAIADTNIINDVSKPARERLITCLRTVLAAVAVGEEARHSWATILSTFMLDTPTAETRHLYHAIESEALRRIEHWLTILIREGALPATTAAHNAHFLNTVLNGLSLARALPAGDDLIATENMILTHAVESLFEQTAKN